MNIKQMYSEFWLGNIWEIGHNKCFDCWKIKLDVTEMIAVIYILYYLESELIFKVVYVKIPIVS